MRSMARESAFDVVEISPRGLEERSVGDIIDNGRVTRLAQIIIEKEPVEIRTLLRNDPALVNGWVATLKCENLQAGRGSDLWVAAIDHIRLSTLSPLKFAAD